jgi:hypothetical protein
VIAQYWLGVHEALINERISPALQEIAWYDWMTEDELRSAVRRWRFVPDGQDALGHRRRMTCSGWR